MSDQNDLRPEISNGERLAISLAGTILEGTLDFAMELYRDSVANPINHKLEHNTICFLFLHTVEMIDGASILIAQSSPSAASLLVRSAFETVLALEYIAQTDSRRRSLAWYVGQVHNQLHYHERHDPDTEAGKAFQEALHLDKYAKYYELPLPGVTIDDFRKKETGLRKILEYSELQEVEGVYQKKQGQMKPKTKHPVWYQLFDGPSNLREMAERVGLKATYADFYSIYSSLGHAHSLARFLTHAEDGMAYAMIRDPGPTQGVTQHAANFILHAIEIFDKMMPPLSVNTRLWYAQYMEPQMRLLADNSLFE